MQLFPRKTPTAAGSPVDAPASFTSDDGSWSVADVAEQFGSTSSTYHDDLLIDAEGNPTTVDPKQSRAQAAAVSVGTAAIAATRAEHLREAGEHHATGTWFRWAFEARQPEAEAAKKDAARLGEQLVQARTTPWTERPKHAENLSLWVKPAFLLGDMAVIFNILHKSGSNPFAAALTGVSAATGAVAAGTVAGHHAALAFQRERRGAPPKDCAGHLVHLYQDEDRSDLPWTMWLAVAAMFSVGLGSAVAFLTTAGGYPREEAFGAGLITALTVLGSFAAAAFGTNAGSDLVDRLATDLAGAHATIEEIGLLRADSQKELTAARTIRAAGGPASLAAGMLAKTIADPPRSNERTHGYVAAESVSDLIVPTNTEVEIEEPPDIDDVWATPAAESNSTPGPAAASSPSEDSDTSNSTDSSGKGPVFAGGGSGTTDEADPSSNGNGRRSPAGA